MSQRPQQLRVVIAIAFAVSAAAGCRTLPAETRSFDLGGSVVGSARIQTGPTTSKDAETNETIPDSRYGANVGWGVRTALRTCVSSDNGLRCLELPVTYFPSTGLQPVSPAGPASFSSLYITPGVMGVGYNALAFSLGAGVARHVAGPLLADGSPNPNRKAQQTFALRVEMGVDTSHKSGRGFQLLLYTFLGPTPALIKPGAGVMPADSTTDYFRAGAWLGYVVHLARR